MNRVARIGYRGVGLGDGFGPAARVGDVPAKRGHGDTGDEDGERRRRAVAAKGETLPVYGQLRVPRAPRSLPLAFEAMSACDTRTLRYKCWIVCAFRTHNQHFGHLVGARSLGLPGGPVRSRAESLQGRRGMAFDHRRDLAPFHQHFECCEVGANVLVAVTAEKLGYRSTHAAGCRSIQELDRDVGSTTTRGRVEPDRTCVVDVRALERAPGEPLIRLVVDDLGIPFEPRTRWPVRDPV